MKIKEVIELIDSKEEKVYTAHKIYNSSLHIKKAIKEWITDKDLPLVSVCIEGPEDNYVNISSYDLLNIYGFSELQALLMIADMENAQKDKDIEKLRYMLSSLTSGRHETKMYLSEEKLKYIKDNNPAVWDEYQKICDESTKHYEKLEDDYLRIIETDL